MSDTAPEVADLEYDAEGQTVETRADVVRIHIDDALRMLDPAFAALATLENHPAEPSTYELRKALEAARTALETAHEAPVPL